MASAPIETDYKALFANPDYYAKLYGEGLPSLESLLRYCLNNQIMTVTCCSGNNSKYAYIYFACKDTELTFYKIVLDALKEANIKDFNYEVRAFINFPGCEYYSGIIFRANKVDANKLFIKIQQSLELRSSFSTRNLIDYFSYIVFQLRVNHLDIKDLKLIYEDNKLYVKFSEQEYKFKNHVFYLNGEIKKLSSLLTTNDIKDFNGKFEVDNNNEELIGKVNQHLSKVLNRL